MRIIFTMLKESWRGFLAHWREALAGLVLFVYVMLLVSCGTSFDPNLAAHDAQYQAERYGLMATGTAEAQIMPITQTSAAITAQAANAQATTHAGMVTQQAQQTQTAFSWTPTPVPTATANMPATQAAVIVIAQATQMQLQTERAERNNEIKSMFWYLAGLAALFVLVAAAYMLIKRFATVSFATNEQGRIIPHVNVLEGVAYDMERSANGVIGTTQKFLTQLPMITANRQAEVTALSQKVDMTTRARLPLSLLKKLDELESNQAPALLAPDEDPILIDYPLPEWADWMQKWIPGRLALGINESGLLQADPEMNAHFLFAGTTGSWKTRGGVRVVATCALASGWQVIIAGKQLDYKVFERHPNAYLVPFSLLTDPLRAIDLLRAVYGEIERRDKMMSRANYSLWRETGQNRTMVIVDEFSNLADALEDIDRTRRDELWRWARMDTAEARKYGIHMVYALQDPTARSIDLRIRRNTTPVMFRVKDAASSRTLLNVGGAEQLSIRHFLANIVKIERGAAFAPSDVEILDFLNSHPTQTADKPDWVEGVLVVPELQDGKQDKTGTPAESVGDWLHSLTPQEFQVVDLSGGDMSITAIVEKVYGNSNGTKIRAAKALIAEYHRRNQGTTTTTTTTTTKIPFLGTAES